jgi:phosphatidylserine decarboxylase
MILKEAKLTDNSINKFFRADPQSQTAFPIAKAGWPIIFASAFVTFVLALTGLAVLSMIGISVTLFICNFFRDPDRLTPDKNDAVISPADGRIVFTGVVNENPFIDGSCLKIGIFMNIFNVHVNRIPFSGKIKKISYYPGKFYSADKEKASTDNEHNALILETDKQQSICFVQIAGLIARRIICHVQEAQDVICGQRFGLICFGSRVDVYLPADAILSVDKGDKVKAGTSILGYLK